MTRIPRIVALALAGGLAITAPSLPAAADGAPPRGPEQEAASRFKKGLELFKDGDARAALIEFRRANELAPNFNVLYNIGQVSFYLQDYPGALGALERYLSEGGSRIGSARRAEVQKDIEKLKARIATVEIVTTVPDAEVSIDDIVVGKSPLSRPILVSAGRRKITVSRPGFTASTKVVEVASGDQLTLTLDPVDLKSTAPADPASPSEPPKTRPAEAPVPSPAPARPVPVAGIVVTGTLTLGAVVTGILALGASSELAAQRASASTSREQLDSAQSKTRAFALTTDIAAGGAIVGLVTTLIVGLSGKKEAAPSGALTRFTHVRADVGPGGGRLIGSF